jgi:hypothetical protein
MRARGRRAQAGIGLNSGEVPRLRECGLDGSHDREDHEDSAARDRALHRLHGRSGRRCSLTNHEPIANEEEYMAALAEISRLMDLDPPVDSDEFAALERLAQLVQAYEAIHYPMMEGE